MNVALPAAFLFLLAIPGYILRSQFSRPERTAPDAAPFGRLLGASVLLALPLNALWVWLAERITPYTVDWQAFIMLLSGTRSATPAVFARAVQAPEGPFFYIASLCLFAAGLGYGARELIQRVGLDRRHRILRMNAPWFYLFSRRLDQAPEPDAVIVSALVEIGRDAFIYVGRLDSYYFTPDGTPDRLVLSSVTRRRMADDRKSGSNEPERFYAIDGDYFVLRYAETKTLNVFYFSQIEAISVVHDEMQPLPLPQDHASMLEQPDAAAPERSK